MYLVLEQALKRIFGTPELMIKNPGWHQEVNSGYRTLSLNHETSTRDERLAGDGACQRYLRQTMRPELHGILIIRYGEEHDYSRRVTAWQQVQHHFRSDERLPEPIRCNPVLLRLWMMHELQLPELRGRKGKIEIKGKSERTVYRWKKVCKQICNEWITLAEDQAQDLLEQSGTIQHRS